MGSKRFQSSYYPQRARWSSGLLSGFDRVRRHLRFPRFRFGNIRLRHILGSALVPGAGIYFRTPGKVARLSILAGMLFALAFLVWLGRAPATVAFGLLLSLHCVSIVYLFQPLLASSRVQFRLLFSLVVLVTLAMLLYLPARNFIQSHLFIPLRVNERVLVVQRIGTPASVKVGDVIVCELAGAGGYHEGVVVLAGYTVGPVLAKAGDVLQFDAQQYRVNGLAFPRLNSMPKEGTVTVPAKTWFIWPDLRVTQHGNVNPAAILDRMMQVAMVPQEAYFGRPFKRWFFWRQT